MGTIIEIQRVLAEMSEDMLPAHKLTQRAGTTMNRFYKHVGKWLARDHLSRERVKGKGYCYFLTEKQRRMYQAKKILVAESYGMNVESDEMSLVTATEELPTRLSFLRMLKEKTVFGEHATLKLIINDYERTLKLRGQYADAD